MEYGLDIYHGHVYCFQFNRHMSPISRNDFFLLTCVTNSLTLDSNTYRSRMCFIYLLNFDA